MAFLEGMGGGHDVGTQVCQCGAACAVSISPDHRCGVMRWQDLLQTWCELRRQDVGRQNSVGVHCSRLADGVARTRRSFVD